MVGVLSSAETSLPFLLLPFLSHFVFLRGADFHQIIGDAFEDGITGFGEDLQTEKWDVMPECKHYNQSINQSINVPINRSILNVLPDRSQISHFHPAKIPPAHRGF